MRFAYLQSLVFHIFLLVFAYENDPNFRTDFYEAFFNYLSPMTLMAIGTTGLVLSIGWLFVNYRQDRKRLVVNSLIPQQVSVQPTGPDPYKEGVLGRVVAVVRPCVVWLSVVFVF